VQDDKEEKKEVAVEMRKRITLLIAALMMALTMSFGSVAAFADPAFGPGNKGGGEGNSGPIGAKCHAPGQEKGTPGCK